MNHFFQRGNLATALRNEGRDHEALLATQKCLELDPDNQGVLMNLGGIYKNLGNLDQATSTLKSLRLNPDNPTALITWAASTKISATLIVRITFVPEQS